MIIPSLTQKRDFDQVRQHGVQAAAKGLVLVTHLRTDLTADHSSLTSVPQTCRLGLIVSKKIGKAVTRNRVKRRFRALCNHILSEHAKPHHDYVLIARHSAYTRDFTALQKDLKFTLHQTNTFVSKPNSMIDKDN